MDVPVVAPGSGVEQQTAPPAAAVLPGGADPQQAAPVPGSGDGKGSLSPVLAKLFSQGAILQPVSVNVSYRVENGNIVTVFTDPHTGKEITQVPAEVVVQMAQFFDKHTGITLDKSA